VKYPCPADNHTVRLVLHAGALLVEAVGTLFIFLDVKRMNARFPSEPPGVLGTLGDPVGYHVWYYHRAGMGFGLLFAGMILAAFVLLLEHKSHVELHRKASGKLEPAPPASTTLQNPVP
jgi:hypothetical protein